MNRRAYLAATTGVLATIAGCTSNSEEEPATTAPTATQTTTQTTQSTATQEPTAETSEATTEEQTTEEQTTAEPSPEEQAKEHIDAAHDHIEAAIATYEDFAGGPNISILDVTTDIRDFDHNDIREPINTARRELDNAEPDASSSQQETISAYRKACTWLQWAAYTQSYLCDAHPHIMTALDALHQANADTINSAADQASTDVDRAAIPLQDLQDADASAFDSVVNVNVDTIKQKEQQLVDVHAIYSFFTSNRAAIAAGVTNLLEGVRAYLDDDNSTAADALETATQEFSGLPALDAQDTPATEPLGSDLACLASQYETAARELGAAAEKGTGGGGIFEHRRKTHEAFDACRLSDEYQPVQDYLDTYKDNGTRA